MQLDPTEGFTCKYLEVRTDLDTLKQRYEHDPEKQVLLGWMLLTDLVEGHGGGANGVRHVLYLANWIATDVSWWTYALNA